jgi:Bacterial SH3 domain
MTNTQFTRIASLLAITVALAGYGVGAATSATAAPLAQTADYSCPVPATTPLPAETAAKYRTVTATTLNVRAQPDLKAQIVGRLRRNSAICPISRTADGTWFEIASTGGAKGYVLVQWTSAFRAGAKPAAAPAAKAPAAAAGAPAPGFDFGAHFKETGILPRMRNEAGMGWAKYQIVMDGGAPDISQFVNAARAAGIKLLIGAVGNRGRANDAEYHKEFARNLANLAAQGADAIEVWNEPNLDREYGGSGRGQVSPENYANMLREAYGAIKSVRQDVIVISGATAPTGYFGGNCTNAGCDDAVFMQRLAATGAGAWMDCVGAHHNGTMVGPDQASGAPVGSADHHQWYFQGTLAVNYNAFGGKKPVCWTELGYVTKDGIAGTLPGGFSWGNNITMQNQADWLRRAVELSRASKKVWIMIIWNADFRQFDDDPQAGYSIFRPDGSCPSCAGLKAVSGR